MAKLPNIGYINSILDIVQYWMFSKLAPLAWKLNSTQFWYQNWVEFNLQANVTNFENVQYWTMSNIELICPIFGQFCNISATRLLEH